MWYTSQLCMSQHGCYTMKLCTPLRGKASRAFRLPVQSSPSACNHFATTGIFTCQICATPGSHVSFSTFSHRAAHRAMHLLIMAVSAHPQQLHWGFSVPQSVTLGAHVHTLSSSGFVELWWIAPFERVAFVVADFFPCSFLIRVLAFLTPLTGSSVVSLRSCCCCRLTAGTRS